MPTCPTDPRLRLLGPTCLFLAWVGGVASAGQPDPLRVPTGRGVVATDTADASRAGAEILARGGNATDAAIAAALALGVVNPAFSGLGGGGFAVVWSARERRAQVLDFREVAPAAASRDMFANDRPAQGKPAASVAGGLAVAVPGEPAGLTALHARLGKLPLARVVEPAARLAQAGFFPSRMLVEVAARMAPQLAEAEPLRRWLRPGGAPLAEDRRLVRPQLAATLTRLGKLGRDAFYRGPVADEIVKTVAARGGILTLDDLERYAPVWREPLVGSFRGRTLYAVPPPSGGVTALEALHFLDALPALPKGSLGGSRWFHRVAEALTHAFADRARWLGDPAFVKVPVDKLASADYARTLATRFKEDGVLDLEAYGTPPERGKPAEPARDHGTSHVCVIDGEGNAVALTTTVNLPFGAQLEAPRSGIILNDEMDDFAARPGQPNAFGLVGAEANAIAPGKRPTSSMTPMLVVEDGKVVLCAGASGGPTIVASTVQAIAAVIDEGVDAQTAVGQTRIYAQWRPDVLGIERDLAPDVAEALTKKGHKLRPVPAQAFAPSCQVIVRRGDELEAASDPRKRGAPAAPPSAATRR